MLFQAGNPTTVEFVNVGQAIEHPQSLFTCGIVAVDNLGSACTGVDISLIVAPAVEVRGVGLCVAARYMTGYNNGLSGYVAGRVCSCRCLHLGVKGVP